MHSDNMVFLYSAMGDYFFNCIEEFVGTYAFEAHIIHYTPTEEAPYTWESTERITFYDRQLFSKKKIIEFLVDLNPRAVYVVNWLDKTYIRALYHYKKKYDPELTVISGFDNPWRGNVRQQAGRLVAYPLVKKLFTYAWVAGVDQYTFARSMGFKTEDIYTNLLCADLSKFQKVYQEVHSEKAKKYPRVLLYVGRLLDLKGIRDLYEAFNGLTDEERNGWTLKIVGEGKLKKELPANRITEITGFIQPDQLPALIEHAGAFCLPGWDDHWGVAVQEFAAGGLPLVTSDRVGSATAFLIPGYNGFQFEAQNKQSLKKALIKMFSLTDKELIQKGNCSFELSNRIKPEHWVAALNHMIGSEK